jgi:hypothetical protein
VQRRNLQAENLQVSTVHNLAIAVSASPAASEGAKFLASGSSRIPIDEIANVATSQMR